MQYNYFLTEAIIAAILLTRVSPVSAVFEKADTIRIVALGDSITYGTGSSSNGPRTGYPAYLQMMLNYNFPGKQFELINSGVSSETTGSGLARIDRVLERYNPQYILIMEGTNDMSLQVPFETVQANLKAMAMKAAARGTVPLIATVLPPHPRLYAAQYARTKSFYDGGYVQSLCRDYNIPMTDLWAEFHEVSNFGDRLFNLASAEHPNTQGYRLLISPAWCEELSPNLGLSFESRPVFLALTTPVSLVSTGSPVTIDYQMSPSNDIVKNVADCYAMVITSEGGRYFLNRDGRPGAGQIALAAGVILDRLPASGRLFNIMVPQDVPRGRYTVVLSVVRTMRSPFESDNATGNIAEISFEIG